MLFHAMHNFPIDHTPHHVGFFRNPKKQIFHRLYEFFECVLLYVACRLERVGSNRYYGFPYRPILSLQLGKESLQKIARLIQFIGDLA